MGGTLVRTIGLARAKAKIGMKNLAYNEEDQELIWGINSPTNAPPRPAAPTEPVPGVTPGRGNQNARRETLRVTGGAPKAPSHATSPTDSMMPASSRRACSAGPGKVKNRGALDFYWPHLKGRFKYQLQQSRLGNPGVLAARSSRGHL